MNGNFFQMSRRYGYQSLTVTDFFCASWSLLELEEREKRENFVGPNFPIKVVLEKFPASLSASWSQFWRCYTKKHCTSSVRLMDDAFDTIHCRRRNYIFLMLYFLCFFFPFSFFQSLSCLQSPFQCTVVLVTRHGCPNTTTLFIFLFRFSSPRCKI